jgi:hypothetical protein
MQNHALTVLVLLAAQDMAQLYKAAEKGDAAELSRLLQAGSEDVNWALPFRSQADKVRPPGFGIPGE